MLIADIFLVAAQDLGKKMVKISFCLLLFTIALCEGEEVVVPLSWNDELDETIDYAELEEESLSPSRPLSNLDVTDNSGGFLQDIDIVGNTYIADQIHEDFQDKIHWQMDVTSDEFCNRLKLRVLSDFYKFYSLYKKFC